MIFFTDKGQKRKKKRWKTSLLDVKFPWEIKVNIYNSELIRRDWSSEELSMKNIDLGDFYIMTEV